MVWIFVSFVGRLAVKQTLEGSHMQPREASLNAKQSTLTLPPFLPLLCLSQTERLRIIS